MSSIKTTLTKSYLKVIILSILILELILLGIIKNYFYHNLEESLLSQIKNSAEIYNRYFSTSSVSENVLMNVDVFWKQTRAQVQILDVNGNVLMDSLGIIHQNKIETPDVKSAISGDYKCYIGGADYTKEKVMCISYPLKKNNSVDGILRFTTTLKDVNNNIYSIVGLFVIIGILVAMISVLLSLFLARTLVEPIKSLTTYAEKMAKGDFENRIKIQGNYEITKLNDTLNYMADEIEKKDKLKNDFISSVSHELRTPLTAIKGWAVVLNCEDTDKDTLKQGLDIIEKESDRLSGMVEELLDFSRFISGKVVIKKQKFYMKDMCHYLDTYLKPRAQRENIEFIVNCSEELPMVEMDENRIKQVCINLLDNAFKFVSNHGKVVFNVGCEDDKLIIMVEDNGCGISKEDLPNVKEKFYKGKNSKSQNGIGLSICDEIIKLHQGEFIIESKVGTGTKITVKLPINSGKESV
ncbi:Signal transduction histidine kinase [Hathewaya proteolytica DSM 3090]|uniref:histidine kinase n=1 Tax=Hathewaya proteolytica DSM 3090 TaxID=1121331 RepID=A0A1M6Q8J4_9CLOT|nr:HAMP domain-containing sensor histidine kinase [Hathewaya proteolytica]SHK16403.1 Signal transduction histidine kinase [Hathewaya proteolytica DSM 3090]